MPVLCKPAVAVPEHVVTLGESLDLARRLYADNKHLDLVLRLVANTGVESRHFIQPLEEVLSHPGVDRRMKLYEANAKQRAPSVVLQALANAGLDVDDIDLIVYVSCTGFMMPSMTAWLINEMGFRSDTRQLPIAQLGCAAGAAAVNRAHDFCLAYPGDNALIVACEFCSLCYQPTDDDIGSLLANGLFGDAVAAAVVREGPADGVRLERNASHLIPHTEDWISYAVKSTGFHFQLDKRVRATMEPLAPVLERLARHHGWDAAALDFYIIHAGGPRILDDLCRLLGVASEQFRYSRATLREYGNIASAVVLDAYRRLCEDTSEGTSGGPPAGRTLIAGFGPGITAEMSLGTYVRQATRRAGTMPLVIAGAT